MLSIYCIVHENFKSSHLIPAPDTKNANYKIIEKLFFIYLERLITLKMFLFVNFCYAL